jgi:CubicO group peptidase (beta-lactamase class C family)
MLLSKALLGSILGFAVSSTARIIATDEVPLLGPSFLSNFDPSNSTAISHAKSEFPGLIDNLFSTGALNRTDLAFHIDVFSASTNKSIYSYSHVGENSKKSVTSGELNDKTISRLGSVTKLFTVYAIIAKAGIEVFSDPVTKYLPELAGNPAYDPLESIRWEDITVGALASQQAGSGGAAGLCSYKMPDRWC